MDPERLLDGEGDDFASALLRSARRDEPDHGAAARAAVARGVGASIVGASGTATAGAIGAASAGIGVGALSIAEWVGIGVVAGLFTAGGVDLARRSAAASPPVEVDFARRTTLSSLPADGRVVSTPLAGAHHADVAANPAPPSPVLLQPPRQPAPLGFVPTAKPAAARTARQSRHSPRYR